MGEFRVARSGSVVGFSVPNGQSKPLPSGFFGPAEYGVVDGQGRYSAEVDGDYEFEFACESAWQGPGFMSSEYTGPGFWVLWRNGAEASGPVPNGVSIRLRLAAGDVVQPAPYAAGIKGSTSGSPQPVTITGIGGLAHWAGRQLWQSVG